MCGAANVGLGDKSDSGGGMENALYWLVVDFKSRGFFFIRRGERMRIEKSFGSGRTDVFRDCVTYEWRSFR